VSAGAKEVALSRTLTSLGAVVVAYSGGVDSAYLALVANRILGARALAVTADSPSYPERHRRLALDIARHFGLHHAIIHTGELEREEYRSNPSNRCYYCKHELYTHLVRLARDRPPEEFVLAGWKPEEWSADDLLNRESPRDRDTHADRRRDVFRSMRTRWRKSRGERSPPP